jgi:hypothetical protein
MWRHIPEDGILHGHCCENLNSYTRTIYFTKEQKVISYLLNIIPMSLLLKLILFTESLWKYTWIFAFTACKAGQFISYLYNVITLLFFLKTLVQFYAFLSYSPIQALALSFIFHHEKLSYQHSWRYRYCCQQWVLGNSQLTN